jgi:hypothetical protein
MDIARFRFVIRVGLAGACFAACGSGPDEHSTPPVTVAASGSGSDHHPTPPVTAAVDPLVGTWRWTGYSPGPTALSVTFNADNTFAFVEQVQPASLPAGSSPLPPPGFDPDSCVPVLFCNGTYEEMVSQGVHVLNWMFTDGAKDKISGCDDPSQDSRGAPLTDGEVASFIDQGHLPPTILTYDVSTNELRLGSAVTTSAGVGRGDGTTFTKAH